ncbi:MAG: FixH family protein, partial [Bauldia litoralis]
MTVSTNAQPKARTQARTGRWIPWTFVGMFGVILAVNGIMVAVAFDTWSGLSTTEPYRRGLAYNSQLAEIERQQKLGWQVSLGFAPGGPGAGELRLRAVDK